jgi:hypothetical protein
MLARCQQPRLVKTKLTMGTQDSQQQLVLTTDKYWRLLLFVVYSSQLFTLDDYEHSPAI